VFAYLGICNFWSSDRVFLICAGVYYFSPRGVGMFSFVGLGRSYIPCNSQDDFHHRGQSHRTSRDLSLTDNQVKVQPKTS
jgi:hypothetical protein